jgi:chaperonin GroES
MVKKTQAKGTKKAAVGVVPIGDRVLVKLSDTKDERSPSGIIIPDSAKKEKAERGIVVAVGEGRRNDSGELIPLRVSVGDTVMFSKYGFDEITIDNVDYVIVSEPSILAIIN